MRHYAYAHLIFAATGLATGRTRRQPMLKFAYRAVKKFNFYARRHNPRRPQMPTPELQRELARRLAEEARELAEAATLKDVIDAIIDSVYIALDCCCVLGVNPSPFFRIVHSANMRKANTPDGWMKTHPVTGKVLKPEGWVSPDAEIESELARQQNLSCEETKKA